MAGEVVMWTIALVFMLNASPSMWPASIKDTAPWMDIDADAAAILPPMAPRIDDADTCEDW